MPQNSQTPPSGSDVATSVLFKKFLGKAEGYVRQPTRMKQLLTDAYQKASEKNEVGTLAHEAWDTLQTLFRLIRSSMSGEYTGVPGTTVAAAVAVLIYFLSPIDLIPDFIPVLGLLDDVALVAWFSTTLKGELDRFHEWETTRPALAASSDSSHKAAAEQAASSMASTSAPKATEQPKPAAESAKQHGTTTDQPESSAHKAGSGSSLPANSGASHAQPAAESAKNAGTTDLPTNPSSHSNTNSGLGSPESSSPRPVHEAGPDAQPSANAPQGDDISRTTDSSRNGTRAGQNDTGGNVR